ncbi:MAG TPA: hypothetical protein PKZ75_09785 [Bacteroidia bacterium]|nr:hypothetical protein [Bacteroidia bacterium]
MKNKITLLLVVVLYAFSLNAQETKEISNDSIQKTLTDLKKTVDVLKKIKFNGWVQAQYQYADTVGAANFDGGDFPANVDNRFMIRRGRIKATFDGKQTQYVVQLNMTERFVNIADIYVKYSEPFTKWLSLQVGVMNRPFGYDIQLSSVVRESPERARYTQILTPNERDMGAELIVEAPKNSKLFGLNFTGGFFNGTGLTIPAVNISDIDSRKDFIGRLSYYKGIKEDKIKFGVGASHYNGYERVANNFLYNGFKTDTLGNLQYKLSDTTTVNYKGSYAKRLYYGLEALFSVKSIIGTTTLRGEYVFGQQPGSATSTKSPQAATTGATYIRNFTGAYVFFIQRIMNSKHELFVKYEWYDPNSKVGASDIGKTGSLLGAADVKFTAIGVGYNFYITENFKFLAYYNMVSNEISKNLSGYTRDLKDNILTLRVQARF